MSITVADIRREVKEKNVTFIRLQRQWRAMMLLTR